MGQSSEDAARAVREVMESYVRAVFTADVATLETIFHPQASMYGYLGDDLLLGGPEPFFADLAGRPSMADSGHDYKAEITHIDVAGKTAVATLVEHGFFGVFSFVNHYSLLLVDGDWKVMSKTFSAL